MSFQKTLILAAAILALTTYCGSGKDFTTAGDGAKKMEGWAGPPEEINKKPYEYFYMKHVAAAKPDTVTQKNGAKMEATCVEAASLQGKANFLRKMVGESLEGASGVADGESTGFVIVSQYSGKVKGLSVADCKPRGEKGKFNGSEWGQCECVIWAKVDGGRDAIVASAQDHEKK